MSKKPNWLLPDKLASFNDDTFRAELSPRRVAVNVNSGEGKVITPEQAADLEGQTRAARKTGEATSHRLVIDKKGQFAPNVWKLYELRKDEEGVERFVRVGQVDTFDEVAAHVPAGGAA